MLPKNKKIKMFEYILKLLGLGGVNKTALTESIERIKLADKKMEKIEQVTMQWSLEDINKETI